MKTSFRTRLLASALIAGAGAFALPAYAQDQEGQTASETGSDTVIVTGSRIQSPTITSVAPVQIIGEQAIRDSGVTNIQDLLLENPAFGVPGLSRTNSAFLTSGTGVATVDLRDLGSDRTLVLINGRRVVSGLPGSATVDLNVIPTQFIERIDILTGGASSLYGSDAVAGVVNFVYKKDFQGVEASGQYNITQRGDTPEYQANLLIGGNFDEGRGNVMMFLGYSNQGGLLSRERPNTYLDDLDTFINITGDPKDYGVPAEGRFSALPLQGVFTAGGAAGCQFTFNQAGALQRGFSSNGGPISAAQAAACGVAPGTVLEAGGFNRQFYRTISVPVQRYLLATRAHYDVSDNISVFAEGTYARTTAAREIEPFGISTAGSTGIYPANGAMPIQTRVLGAGGTFTIVNNPYVPQAIFNAATDTDGDGLRDIAFSRRLGEFGTRNSRTERDFFRFVVGLEGQLFDNKFNWDVSYNYGRTSESQEGNGQVNINNFRNALAVVPAGTIPGTVGPQCADANARANGCVPVNVFGAGSISQAAINYIQANQTFQTKIEQQVVTANLSGSLFDLPAGPFGIAVGVEYRKEKSSENNDSLTNQGLNGGNALPDTAGEFNVKEAYGEINIPILADTPGFHSLSARGAARISDYSTVGTVYSYSAGAEWAPIRDVQFKGTYARAVRAPNIGELFTGPSQTFPTGLIDPCLGVTAATAGTLGTVCRSFAGVNANITANNGAFAVTQSDRQSVSGFNLGNPNLSEEKSDSYTASLTINPRSIQALRNFTLRIDYYNISIDDAIVGVGRQFILNKCFQEGDQSFCNFITRRAQATAVNSAGSLEFINQAAVNGGRLKSSGIDVTLDYVTNLANSVGLPGKLNLRGTYTRLLQGYVNPIPGEDTRDNFKGEIGNPVNKFTATAAYRDDTYGLSFTGTYIGKSYEDDQLLLPDFDPKEVGVGAEFYLDMQASFRPSSNYEFYFGIDNLLDNKAPNILSGSPFNVTGTDTAADVYDVFGRRFYMGARLRF